MVWFPFAQLQQTQNELKESNKNLEATQYGLDVAFITYSTALVFAMQVTKAYASQP